MYSKSGYEEMSGISQGAQMVSNLIGKVLRTGRSPSGAQMSEKEQLSWITDVVTHIEQTKGEDEAITTFIESVGKGLQKPGEFVNDNAGGALDDSTVNRTGAWRDRARSVVRAACRLRTATAGGAGSLIVPVPLVVRSHPRFRLLGLAEKDQPLPEILGGGRPGEPNSGMCAETEHVAGSLSRGPADAPCVSAGAVSITAGGSATGGCGRRHAPVLVGLRAEEVDRGLFRSVAALLSRNGPPFRVGNPAKAIE
ncbi:hypothetical protein SBADM41S_01072 [Streptomyces badius]